MLLQLHSVDDGQGDEIVAPLIDAFQGVPRQVLAVEEDNGLESMPEEASETPVSEGRVIEKELAKAGVLQVLENVSKGITDGHFLLVANPQELLTKLYWQMQLFLKCVFVIWSILVLSAWSKLVLRHLKGEGARREAVCEDLLVVDTKPGKTSQG